MLASVGPAVIVLAHTATSYFLGRDAEAQLLARLSTRYEVPVISALGSVVAACERMNVRRVAVATAYDEALTRHGTATIATYGLEVVQARWLDQVRSIFDETAERVYGLARAADRPDADAVFISGVGLPTLEVVGALETDLGKPVFSSATAMMWNALRFAGVRDPVPGHGRRSPIRYCAEDQLKCIGPRAGARDLGRAPAQCSSSLRREISSCVRLIAVCNCGATPVPASRHARTAWSPVSSSLSIDPMTSFSSLDWRARSRAWRACRCIR